MRCRAAREHRYGLTLVTCPECGWGCVQNRPEWSRYRRARMRVQASLATLLIQGTILFLLTMVNLINCVILLNPETGRFEVSWLIANWLVTLWVFFLAPLLTGVWLTAGLSHLKRRRAFLYWFAWMFTWVVWITIGSEIYYTLYHEWSLSELQSDLHQKGAVYLKNFFWGFCVLVVFFIFAIVLGIPTGRWMLMKNVQRMRLLRSRYRKKLARRRCGA